MAIKIRTPKTPSADDIAAAVAKQTAENGGNTAAKTSTSLTRTQKAGYAVTGGATALGLAAAVTGIAAALKGQQTNPQPQNQQQTTNTGGTTNGTTTGTTEGETFDWNSWLSGLLGGTGADGLTQGDNHLVSGGGSGVTTGAGAGETGALEAAGSVLKNNLLPIIAVVIFVLVLIFLTRQPAKTSSGPGGSRRKK